MAKTRSQRRRPVASTSTGAPAIPQDDPGPPVLPSPSPVPSEGGLPLSDAAVASDSQTVLEENTPLPSSPSGSVSGRAIPSTSSGASTQNAPFETPRSDARRDPSTSRSGRALSRSPDTNQSTVTQRMESIENRLEQLISLVSSRQPSVAHDRSARSSGTRPPSGNSWYANPGVEELMARQSAFLPLRESSAPSSGRPSSSSNHSHPYPSSDSRGGAHHPPEGQSPSDTNGDSIPLAAGRAPRERIPAGHRRRQRHGGSSSPSSSSSSSSSSDSDHRDGNESDDPSSSSSDTPRVRNTPLPRTPDEQLAGIYQQALEALAAPQRPDEPTSDYHRRVNAAVRSLSDNRRPGESDQEYQHRRVIWASMGSAHRERVAMANGIAEHQSAHAQPRANGPPSSSPPGSSLPSSDTASFSNTPTQSSQSSTDTSNHSNVPQSRFADADFETSSGSLHDPSYQPSQILPDPANFLLEQSGTQRRINELYQRENTLAPQAPFVNASGGIQVLTQQPIFLQASKEAARRIIEFYLSTPSPAQLAGRSTSLSKQLKIELPNKYHGDDDTIKFEDWLLDICQWLSLSGYSGPTYESERQNALGFMLDGRAKRWHKTVVATPRLDHPNWTFTEIIMQLHSRFITKVSAVKAADQYAAVKYSASRGVTGLYDDLLQAAQRMFQHPGEYDLKRKFIEKLPLEIKIPLVRTRGITAEEVDFRTLRDHAVNVDSTNGVSDKLGIGNDWLPYSSELKEAGTSRPSRDKKRNRDRRENLRDTTQRDRSDHKEREEDRPRQVVPVHKSSYPRQAAPQNQINTQDRDRRRCFTCGKTGHIAKDHDNGPRARALNLNAMAVPVNDQSEPSVSGQTSSSHHSKSSSHRSHRSGSHLSKSDFSRLDQYELDTASQSSLHSVSEYSDEPSTPVQMSRMDLTQESLAEHSSASSVIGMRAMTINLSANRPTKKPYKGEGKDANIYRAAMRRKKDSSVQPDRSQFSNLLTANVKINGHLAWTLFDSGCTGNMVSPEFVQAHKLKVFELEHPVMLQLGTKGSRSTINHGTNAELSIENGLTTVEYFDVVNLDQYDAVLGGPYLWPHGINLDFDHDVIRFRDWPSIKPFKNEKEASVPHAIETNPRKYGKTSNHATKAAPSGPAQSSVQPSAN